MPKFEVHRPIMPGHAALPPVIVEADTHDTSEDVLDFTRDSRTICTFARGQWAYVLEIVPDKYTEATAAVS